MQCNISGKKRSRVQRIILTGWFFFLTETCRSFQNKYSCSVVKKMILKLY